VTDSYPPVRNPSRDKNKMIKFFTIINQLIWFFSHIMNSMMGGRTRASTVLQTAPIKLSSKSSSGTSMATVNVKRTITLLNISSPRIGLLLKHLTNFETVGNIIWMATKNWIA
jgi:hypothetical protein